MERSEKAGDCNVDCMTNVDRLTAANIQGQVAGPPRDFCIMALFTWKYKSCEEVKTQNIAQCSYVFAMHPSCSVIS